MRLLRMGFVPVAAVALLAFTSAGWALDVPGPNDPRTQTQITPPPFDANTFSEPTEIENRWLPLTPGSRFILDGQSDLGDGLRPHRVIFTVTDVTKVVNGVRNVVVLDTDIHDGELVEEEIAFFAQDDFGNVWNFGEYPEEYEGGQFVGAPETWLAGIARAQAGFLMLANPREGTPPYVQGFAPEIDFFNAAQVLATHQEFCTPSRCYHNVLVTDEFSPNDPEKGHVHKLYAHGVGNVGALPAGDPEMETLALTELVQLDPQSLAEARARTLELDRRAYRFAADVWQGTPPAEVLQEPDDEDGGEDEGDEEEGEGHEGHGHEGHGHHPGGHKPSAHHGQDHHPGSHKPSAHKGEDWKRHGQKRHGRSGRAAVR